MNQSSSHQFKPIKSAFIWLGMMAALGTIMMLVYAFYVAYTGNQSVNQLRGLQVAQTFCIFILPALLAARCWTPKPFAWLRMTTLPDWRLICLIVAMMIIALPGINLLADLNTRVQLPASLASLEAQLKAMEESAQELMEMFLQVDSLWGMLGCLLLMALLPAIGEEMCFRGMCQGLLMRGTSRAKMAIWVTAIVFSAIHLQFYGFVPRLLLGALLGYLLFWTDSLWAPIVAHFTNNACAVVSYYVGTHTNIGTEAIDNIGCGSNWWLGMISLLLTAVMIYFVRTYARSQSSRPRPECPAES